MIKRGDPMVKKQTYKILLSDNDKKLPHSTIHNNTHVKPPFGAVRSYWN